MLQRPPCTAFRPPLLPQLVLNVNIKRALVLTEITNPPDVTVYRVRIYSGPATNSTFVKVVQFTADQATTIQPINMATLGLPAGTYSVATQPLGVNGAGPESARSNYVTMQARRSATRGVRPGRRLVEDHDGEGQPTHTRADRHAMAGAPPLHQRHRNRHLL